MTKPWLISSNSEEKSITVMGAKVFLKPLKYGKSRQAMGVSIKIDPMTGKADMDTSLLATLRALYQIKDWELTDESGAKLPVSLETLDEELNEEFVEELISKINEKQGDTLEVSEEEKKQ